MARQARYIVQKAPGVGGAPIPEDEPCIVIRGQDRLAVEMIEHYMDRYNRLPGNDPVVLDELNQHAEAIVRWQAENPPKTADR